MKSYFLMPCLAIADTPRNPYAIFESIRTDFECDKKIQ